MRKLLLLICALLTGVSGAWAKTALEYTALTTGVDYVLADNGQQWFLSNAGKTNCLVEANKYQLVATGTEGQYYLRQTSTNQYIATATSSGDNATWTSEQASAQKFTIDCRNDVTTQVRFVPVNQSGLYFNSQGNSSTRPIWFTGTGDWSYWIVFTYADVYADFLASLPELTTDVNNPKYYSIRSYDRGGYLTSNGAGQGMTHVDFAAGSSWYFTAISGNNSGSVIGGVIAHCSDGTQMKQNWQTAATGETLYILPNGVNTNGLSISKTLPISGSSCCDANNNNTGVGNWSPSANDWQGTTWVFKNTVPIGQTGYYYFKGMATDRHPYLYSDFVTKNNVATYHHDLPSTPSNGHIWKVTNSGTTFALINGEGLPLTTTPGSTSSVNNPHETLTLSAASAGPDYFFTEAINLTSWGNDTRLTTWTDGGSSPSDNRWTFELVDVSAGVYNVVVQGNDDGYVTYSGQNAKNGGFFVASSITEGNLTAKAIDGYTTSISISDRTITVSYNQQISYTLTDANGATYSWSASAPFGVAPTLSGCAGYSLSNEEWNEGSHSYSANITFPFAVSSNEKDNYTFIGQFNNKNGYSATEFLWHVSGTSIIIHSGDLPTTEDSDHDKYLWSIIPAFSNGAFTFTIKNKSTGTYVYSTCTENRHNVGDVTLSETATPMTYNSATPTGTCSPINAWYLPSTSKYLSANSVFNGADAVLGVYGAVHDGISSGFPTYGDLISIYWSSNGIAANIAKAGQCGYPSATNEYIVALNGVKTALNGGSYPSTANSYNNLRTWYEGALSADVVKPEVGKFYKFKSPNNRYIHAVTPDNIMQMNADGTSADAIFYIPYAGRFLSYTKGYAMSGRKISNGYYNSGGYSTYTIDHYAGHGLGTIRIKCDKFLFDYSNSTDIYDTSTGNDAGRCWTVEEVTSLPVTISSAGYATFNSPVAVSIPKGVTAFQAKISGNRDCVNLVSIDDGVIPANFPVVLKGAEGTYNFPITTTEVVAGDYHSNTLQGTIAAISVSSTIYTLQMNSEGTGVGFYEKTNGTLKGFSAYLTDASGMRGFVFNEITGIDNTVIDNVTIENAYDLSGRRAGKVKKGVYILDGKKVLF